jgi:hypothetical protein
MADYATKANDFMQKARKKLSVRAPPPSSLPPWHTREPNKDVVVFFESQTPRKERLFAEVLCVPTQLPPCTRSSPSGLPFASVTWHTCAPARPPLVPYLLIDCVQTRKYRNRGQFLDNPRTGKKELKTAECRPFGGAGV